MRFSTFHPNSRIRLAVAVILVLVLTPAATLLGQADAHRGLWVGQVSLTRVNEVSDPLDANNFPAGEDRKIPSPTADEAHLRLILHVNGAGQVSLLKDVAILNRQAEDTPIASENELSLVTDERLYGQFPPQPAVRIASTVFDFGDSKATEAVDAVLEAAAAAAASSVNSNSTTDFSTLPGRLASQETAYQFALLTAMPIVDNADVGVSFHGFITGTNFTEAIVDQIALSPDALIATNTAQPALMAATNLQNQSFYNDTRAVEMIHQVLGTVAAAIDAGATDEEKIEQARNVAASFADVANDHGRFLASRSISDLILSGANAAALAATNSGATVSNINLAVRNDVDVMRVRGEAVTLESGTTTYDDKRSSSAVDIILEAMIDQAGQLLPAQPSDEETIRGAVQKAGEGAFATNVIRFPVSAAVPTADYTSFIKSDPDDFNESQRFQTSADVAARAAAEGAVFERANNGLWTEESMRNAALVSAVQALQNIYAAAARAVATELPMAGTFGPGEGDARLRWEIREANPTDSLGLAALSGVIQVPANHPTNPFRHRRHPDHTSGFNLRRDIRLDFDETPNSELENAGFGVDRITGTYREEIFGLHKPLGTNKDIGLRVEGKFQLNRISFIDTLNAL